MLIDVVPTIVDLLDIEVDWDLDGQSLVGPPRSDTTKPVVYSGPERGDRAGSGGRPDGAAQCLPDPVRGPWPTVARVGPDAELVGRPVRDLRVIGPSALTWSVEEAEVLADYVPGVELIPLVLHGTAVSTTRPRHRRRGSLVLNGQVAGALEFADQDDEDDEEGGRRRIRRRTS